MKFQEKILLIFFLKFCKVEREIIHIFLRTSSNFLWSFFEFSESWKTQLTLPGKFGALRWNLVTPGECHYLKDEENFVEIHKAFDQLKVELLGYQKLKRIPLVMMNILDKRLFGGDFTVVTSGILFKESYSIWFNKDYSNLY